MGMVEIKVNPKAGKAVTGALEKGLKKVGMIAETYAKGMAPVDTGLLRNSITFALGGGMANTQSYTDNTGEIRTPYEGSAPADSGGELTLYVGTNVHYAPYIELGHMTSAGNFVEPKSFLRPAMADHADEYRRILEDELAKL